MTSEAPPRQPTPPTPPQQPPKRRLRWNGWNLLLLIPFFMLFTPLYNRVDPKLFGMPFFYWFQLACVAVGITTTLVVYLMTRDEYVVTDRPDRLNVDILDEGASR
jgi:uncharacterized membrane protein YhdT